MGFRIDKALAVAMKPNDLGAERNGFGKQLRIGRHWNAQAGTDEVGLETRCEVRMRHHRGKVRHDLFSLDLKPVELRKLSEKCRLDVRLRCGSVEPERIRSACE